MFRVDDEEESNDTDVSDDEEAELGSGYEIPTREEEYIEVESLPSTEDAHFTSVSTPTSNSSSSSLRSLKNHFVASVRAKYKFAAFMRWLKHHSWWH